MAFFAHTQIEYVIFIASFISATLIPCGSEVLVAGAVAAQPTNWPLLWTIATVGNSLGAMTSWLIGRYVPNLKKEVRAVNWLKRHGLWTLLLSWLPIVGDAIPLAAGWLRLNFWASLIMIAIGKGLRFAVIVAITLKAMPYV